MSFARKPITRLVIAAVLVVGPIAGTALAKGGQHTQNAGDSLSLVLLDSTDGVAHWGQRVTFDVSSTTTDKPFVRVDCYQDGQLVYSSNAGFYESYPWPWDRTFTLKTSGWTGGPSDCTATLYYWDGRHFRNLTAIAFAVAA